MYDESNFIIHVLFQFGLNIREDDLAYDSQTVSEETCQTWKVGLLSVVTRISVSIVGSFPNERNTSPWAGLRN
jgi:hypothetical protein